MQSVSVSLRAGGVKLYRGFNVPPRPAVHFPEHADECAACPFVSQKTQSCQKAQEVHLRIPLHRAAALIIEGRQQVSLHAPLGSL